MKNQATVQMVERILPTPEQQAEDFGSVREAHRMGTSEDYVELIDDLIKSTGKARLVDVAERMGISQPSAGKTIARLQRDGLVTSAPDRSIFLTEEGKRLANHCRQRHDTVYRFLIALGIPEKIAKRDSEGVEHHVSKETLAAFKRFIGSPDRHLK